MHQVHAEALSAPSCPLRDAFLPRNERLRKTNLKLHQDSSGALNTVTGYGAGYVEINLERHVGSILVMPESPVIAWPVASFEAMSP